MDMESYLLFLFLSLTIFGEYISMSLAVILHCFNTDGISLCEHSTRFGMLPILNQCKQQWMYLAINIPVHLSLSFNPKTIIINVPQRHVHDVISFNLIACTSTHLKYLYIFIFNFSVDNSFVLKFLYQYNINKKETVKYLALITVSYLLTSHLIYPAGNIVINVYSLLDFICEYRSKYKHMYRTPLFHKGQYKIHTILHFAFSLNNMVFSYFCIDSYFSFFYLQSHGILLHALP